MSDSIPRVFISYSHDSPDHKNRVLSLSERLRQDGLETSLDQYVRGTPHQKWHRWMLDQLDWADFVLVICSETYYRRFRGREEFGKGKGADWEGALITQEIYDARSATTKFVPVIFEPTHERFIPEPLRGHTFYLPVSKDGYQALYDFLLDQSGIEPGEIGILKKKPRKRGTPLSFENPGQRPRLFSSAPLHHGAERLFGREGDLKRLDAAWDDPRTHVLTIVAWGGVGKTSLVVEWMAHKAADGWSSFEREFDWTFYSQGTREQGAVSAELFIAEALKFFGDPDPTQGSSWDRGDRLARLVAERRSLLVLDGLEPLQHPPDSVQSGELKDPALEILLKGLARHNPGLCLITTRERVDDLKTWRTTTAPEWNLDNFSPEAGAAVLHQAGARRAGAAEIKPEDQELKDASEEVKGHALTLQLLGSYLARAHRGDIRKRTRVKLEEADKALARDGSPYGHAFKVMHAYEIWLQGGGRGWFQRLVDSFPASKRKKRLRAQRQLAVLRLLGLFDRPADPGCLAALRQPPAIPGFTEPLAGLDEEEWNLIISALESAGLVKTPPWEPKWVKGFGEEKARKRMDAMKRNIAIPLGEPEDFTPPQEFPAWGELALDAHPLLRQYFAKRLRETAAKAWREGHRRLYQHLKASVPYWPEGADGLQPLCQAVWHGCHAGLHRQALDIYKQRILRTPDFYLTTILGGFGQASAVISCFFEVPWGKPSAQLTSEDKSWITYQAAWSLRALGRVGEAADACKKAFDFSAEESKDPKEATTRAATLSDLLWILGDLQRAAAIATKGIHCARGNEKLALKNKVLLARALYSRNPCEKETTDIMEKLRKQPLSGWMLYFYYDLVLDSSPTEDNLNRIEELARNQLDSESDPGKQQTPVEQALVRLALARVTVFRSGSDNISSEVKSELEAVIKELRNGRRDVLPHALLVRARILPESASVDLDEASDIAERGPMRLFLADIHLHRARLFRDKTALAQARQLIEQCGYGRRKEELEDALEAAKHWPEKSGSAMFTDILLTETDLVPETEQPEGEITMPATTRDQILISYSHKDKKLFQEVKTMLAPAIQKGIVNIWDDTRIRPGAQWKAEIEKALASARVGVLLVSENFLESEFITKNELPPLLKAAQDGGATIFWVYLSPCLYQHTEIEQFQAAHDISKPLNELTKPRRNAAWREICNKLLQIAQNP